MSSKILIRQIEKTDKHDLFNLRNIPEVYRWFINSGEINYDDHENWVNDRVINWPEFTLVASKNNEPVGLCYLKFISDLKFEISIHVNPTYQNFGVGSNLLSELLIVAGKREIKTILANVNSDNEQSIIFFRKHGFIDYENQNNENQFLDKRVYITMKLQLQ